MTFHIKRVSLGLREIDKGKEDCRPLERRDADLSPRQVHSYGMKHVRELSVGLMRKSKSCVVAYVASLPYIGVHGAERLLQ